MNLISGLLSKDPVQRLGAGPLDGIEIMKHPFFNGIDWEALMQ